MLRTMALFPILFGIGRERKALMFSHGRGKHIGIVILVDYKVAVFVFIEKARCKFIELKATSTSPIL